MRPNTATDPIRPASATGTGFWVAAPHVVQREEFEAVKDMARLAHEENEALKTRIAALEAKLGGTP